MQKYRVPFDYVYKILGDNEYIFGPSPLEVAICEETLWARFHIPFYPFIERLLDRYGLVPA